VRAPRHIVPPLCALAAACGCGGGERQDADEPRGSFRLEVAEASFPARQSIAERSTLRIRVRNPERRTVPNVAVTVETRGAPAGAAAVAFARREDDPRLADPDRPVWVLDRGPDGGTSAYAGTWSLGPLDGGETRTFEWELTAVEPGRYAVDYRASPGLDGRARLAAGTEARGTLAVRIDDEPVPARVGDDGDVVRGERAGEG